MTLENSRTTGLWIAAGLAIVFGALTIFSGGQALFGPPATQAAAGNADARRELAAAVEALFAPY